MHEDALHLFPTLENQSGAPGRIRTDDLRLIWATGYKPAALPLSYRGDPKKRIALGIRNAGRSGHMWPVY